MRKHRVNPATTILLCGEVDEKMVSEFMEQFAALDSQKRAGGITVRITSHGGCAGAGFAIYDAIRLAKNHVTTETWGMAESSAALIFQAGHTRSMAPSGRLLLHDMQTESNSATGSRGVQAQADDVKAMEELYFRVIADRADIEPEQVKRWCGDTTSFSAAEACNVRLADNILEE